MSEVTITREQVIMFLAKHSLTPKTQTYFDMNLRKMVESGSSFDEMIGIKEKYVLREVEDWLGY